MDNNKTKTLTKDEYRNFQKFIESLPSPKGYMVEHINDYYKVSFLKDIDFCWEDFFNYNDGDVRGVS